MSIGNRSLLLLLVTCFQFGQFSIKFGIYCWGISARCCEPMRALHTYAWVYECVCVCVVCAMGMKHCNGDHQLKFEFNAVDVLRWRSVCVCCVAQTICVPSALQIFWHVIMPQRPRDQRDVVVLRRQIYRRQKPKQIPLLRIHVHRLKTEVVRILFR